MSKSKHPSRIAPWRRNCIFAIGCLLLLTGVGWLLLEEFVRVEGTFGPERHPLERWMLVTHGVTSYAALLMMGMISGTHVIPAWRRRKNRLSGMLVLSVLFVLILTALALYYLAGDLAREWTSALHWMLGLAAPPMLVTHIVLGKRQARSN